MVALNLTPRRDRLAQTVIFFIRRVSAAPCPSTRERGLKGCARQSTRGMKMGNQRR
jgi:hypothetical protein